MVDGPGWYEQIQECARDHNRCKHTDDDAQEQRCGEANNNGGTEVATEVVQDCAGNHGRTV